MIENFVIHGLVGAVALPMTVLNVSGLIDSTWAVVSDKLCSAAHWRLRLKCGVPGQSHGDGCSAVRLVPLQVMNRAARAGELLAHVLMSGAHGDCPVTLIGNSMGARLVLWDLRAQWFWELCRRPHWETWMLQADLPLPAGAVPL